MGGMQLKCFIILWWA